MFGKINHKELSAVVCSVWLGEEIYCTNCHRMFITFLMCFHTWIYEHHSVVWHLWITFSQHICVLEENLWKTILNKFCMKFHDFHEIEKTLIMKYFTIFWYDSWTLWRYQRFGKKGFANKFPKRIRKVQKLNYSWNKKQKPQECFNAWKFIKHKVFNIQQEFSIIIFNFAFTIPRCWFAHSAKLGTASEIQKLEKNRFKHFSHFHIRRIRKPKWKRKVERFAFVLRLVAFFGCKLFCH